MVVMIADIGYTRPSWSHRRRVSSRIPFSSPCGYGAALAPQPVEVIQSTAVISVQSSHLLMWAFGATMMKEYSLFQVVEANLSEGSGLPDCSESSNSNSTPSLRTISA